METYFESENIARQHKNEEIQSLKSLYNNHADKLFGIISILVENNGMREEILQKTFVRIMFEREKYNPAKSTIFTWMVDITIEVAAEHFRVQLIDMQKEVREAYEALKQ